MRSEEEIKARIYEAQNKETAHLEWVDKAMRKYESDRKLWGESADYGEVQTANEAYQEAANEALILKWVLGIDQLKPLK